VACRSDRDHHARLYPLTGNGFKFEYMRALNGVQLGEARKPNHYFRVLAALWNYADEDGRNAFPTIQQLAKDCCISTRTVDRALDYLLGTGWVRQESRGRTGRASVYSLHIPTRHGCRTTDEIEHDTGVTPTRHRCQTNTTSASYQRDTGVAPVDPVTDHGIDHGIDPHLQSVPASSWPDNLSNSIVRTPMTHDSPDEYNRDECSECFYWKRPCGKVRDERKLVSVAAEPDWDSLRSSSDGDEPPF
jgi:Helix-turn-helix domain